MVRKYEKVKDNICERDLAYVAGLLDGEGSISIFSIKDKIYNKRKDYSLIVRITNTDFKMLDYVKEKIGGNYYVSANATSKRRKIWNWQLNDLQAEIFLKKIKDYLITKKERAELALEFRKNYRSNHQGYYRLPNCIIEKRQEGYLKLKELNRRGLRYAT